MAERFKAHAWKACWGESPSGVRIPVPPPYTKKSVHVRIAGRPLFRGMKQAGKLPVGFLGQIGAAAQIGQLLPGNARVDLAVPGKGAEAAIRAGDHPVHADNVDEAAKSLTDQFGMLDIV